MAVTPTARPRLASLQPPVSRATKATCSGGRRSPLGSLPGRLIELRNRCTPDLRIAQANRLIGPDVLEQEGEHREPIFVGPEQLSPDQLVLIGCQLSSQVPFVLAP